MVLLSGDRHVTAAYQVLGRFIEVTSGPFGAENNHGSPYNPDEMFMLHDHGNFFVVLEVDTTAVDPALTLEVHQVGRGLVRKRAFSWPEINGEASISDLRSVPRLPTLTPLTSCGSQGAIIDGMRGCQEFVRRSLGRDAGRGLPLHRPAAARRPRAAAT